MGIHSQQQYNNIGLIALTGQAGTLLLLMIGKAFVVTFTSEPPYHYFISPLIECSDGKHVAFRYSVN